ncbi:MAG TPA: hypothetical protein VHT28_14365 [Silvibacterium sp.]|nr:hypothetical protein [Silvibacterium sp.]
MNLTHYDLDSLVYLSTDIVIARMSEDAEHSLSATVTETLYGALNPGDRVERLSPFLSFFRPMEDGMNVILFLDRRPHSYDFFHSDAAKSSFAVPPSGVYLIDTYGHVHHYYQEANPGPYVAQGYSFFVDKSIPTQEQDIKLPSLKETKVRIAASIKSIETVRPLLDKTATREDIPKLFALLNSRKERGAGCGFQAGDAVVERVSSQIRSFKDPELLLRLRAKTVDVESDIGFVQGGPYRDAEFTLSRVQYLLQVLSDKKADPSLRMAAAEILVGVNRFHSGAHNEPEKTWLIDNEWLIGSAEKIRTSARAIFDDDAESIELRSLCLRFLPLDAEALADVKRIYARTHSNELRYAIEDSFLQVSDSLYQSLGASGGPVTSIVLAAGQQSCAMATAGNTAFIMKYHQRQDFHESSMFASRQYVLTNVETGQRIVPAKIHQLGGWSSMNDGEGWFELSRASDLAPGKYSLRLEFSLHGEVVSPGYPLAISVTDTPSWRVTIVKSPD